jgi:hypothetical protein
MREIGKTILIATVFGGCPAALVSVADAGRQKTLV